MYKSVLKEILIFLLVLCFNSFAYVLVTGSQMKSNTSFDIDYDYEFRIPFISSVEDSLTQDSSIVGLLTDSIISACIADVSPKRIVSNGTEYETGSEVLASSGSCFIDYDHYESWRVFGWIPPPKYNANDLDSIYVGINSNINKVREWGPDGSNTAVYRNPKNTLTHELVHSVMIHHSPSNSELMPDGGTADNDPVTIGEDERHAYLAIYNSPEILKPTLPTSERDSIIVIKGQKIDFKVIPSADETPSYTYGTSFYKVKPRYSNSFLDSINLSSNDTIRYTWDSSGNDTDTLNVECFIKGAERIGESSFIETVNGQNVTRYCDQRSAKRRFSVCDYLVYEPKADTAVVAKAGNYIPVNLRIEDIYKDTLLLNGVYNIDSLRVQYVLWNDGFAWLNDSISTSQSIDPREEFKWYFAQFDSDTTINMNHPDLEVNADYFIKAHLYQKDGENLTYIGTAESGNFDIMPEVMMWIDPTVSENEVYQSFETQHTITAVCMNPDGSDHPLDLWDEMSFYYKFDGESSWTHIFTTKNEGKETPEEYICTWDSGTMKGRGWLKAEAHLTWTTKTTSDSLEFRLLEAEIGFDEFMYKQTDGLDKESLYTTEHEIGVSYGYWGDEGWIDDLVNEIKFLYKYPQESEYTQINSEVVTIFDEYNLYKTEFDAGENKDSVTIKVEINTLADGDSITLTKEKTFGLIDRYLTIDAPNSADVSVVDFESILERTSLWGKDTLIEQSNFESYGRICAEEGFDIHRFLFGGAGGVFYQNSVKVSLQNPLETIPAGIYNWVKFFSESKGFIYNGQAKVSQGSSVYLSGSEYHDEDNKELVEYDEERTYNNLIIRCKPGKYTQKVRSYEWLDETRAELAHGEKQDLLIPDWKLKTFGADFRFWPPIEKKDYACDNDSIPFCIWRPAVSGEVLPEKTELNTTYIDAYKDSLYSSCYSYSVICEPEVSEIITWNSSNEDPGFYRIEGKEVNINTNTNVEMNTEIQICPFYDHWEWDGSFSDKWIGGADTLHWGVGKMLYHPDIRTKEVLRDYYLEARYSTDAAVKNKEIISESIRLSDYPEYFKQIDIVIGIPAHTVNPATGQITYDELLADYKIWISKDGGSNWTVYKTISSEGYYLYPSEGIIFKPFFFNLGKTESTNEIRLKITKEGINSFFTTEPEVPKSQTVAFDEIVVKYSKHPVMPSPLPCSINMSTTKSNTVVVNWDAPDTNGLEYALLRYNIFRNGMKIGVLSPSSVSYEDEGVEPGTFYNYTIEAEYSVIGDPACEGINKKSAMIDCSMNIDLTSEPRPFGLTATTGTEGDYDTVSLSWPALICGLEITGYRIYRGEEMIGFTSETNYKDCFLSDGEYSYTITGVYNEQGNETLPSDPDFVAIETPSNPPAVYPPEGFSISNSDDSILLSWNSTEGATQYKIYRSLYPDKNYYEIGITSDTFFIDNMASFDEGVYYYKITADIEETKTGNTKTGNVKSIIKEVRK
ncbi:MAG: hypothetical protein RBS89_02830 [Candidatus Delongbacteria bacterium]|jgi:hypothetical protein|nr:hypothetical protein [Candidatus Delongbacteria bacterium]